MLKYKYIWGIKREGVYFYGKMETGHCLISDWNSDYD